MNYISAFTKIFFRTKDVLLYKQQIDNIIIKRKENELNNFFRQNEMYYYNKLREYNKKHKNIIK